jgi:hypothetical protein
MALPYYPSPAAITAFRRAPLARPTLSQLAEASSVSDALGMSIKRALAYIMAMDRAEVLIRHLNQGR